MWCPRTVIDWPDRHPWAAAVFAVPLTIVGLRGVAMHPSVFLPLLVLGEVALVVMACLAEQQAPIAATPQKRNRQSRANRPRPPAPWRPQAHRKLSRLALGTEARAQAETAEAQAVAAEARARAQARAEAAEAQALATEARTRATWLRLAAEAKANEAPHED